MSDNFKAVQAENYQLRDYIINLQSRLIESQGDFPQPPPNVDLPHPSRRHEASSAAGRPSAMDVSALNSLRASAAQAGHDVGSSASKHYPEESYGHDSHMAKRMKSDGIMDSSIAAQEALQGGGGAIEPRIANSPQTRDLTIGSVLNGSTRDGNAGRQMLSA